MQSTDTQIDGECEETRNAVPHASTKKSQNGYNLQSALIEKRLKPAWGKKCACSSTSLCSHPAPSALPVTSAKDEWFLSWKSGTWYIKPGAAASVAPCDCPAWARAGVTPSASAGSKCVQNRERGKQIKAITLISGAWKAQTPLWLTVYPEHVNNSYCNQDPLLLAGLVGWLIFNQLPFCNHMCCVPTGAPFLA